MKILKKVKFIPVFLLIIVMQFIFVSPQKAYAAQSTVDLGTAAPFAILAGTPAITDAGNASVITGNVGLSPRTSADIGLWCSQMIGLSKIYGVDTAYTGSGGTLCFNGLAADKTLVDNAKLDLDAAYLDAAGRTSATTINTELSGQTLVPGVYVSGSTAFGITAGAPLILDGQGDPNAVFIFEGSDESAGALTVGPGSVVSLTNGACASNVFWRFYGAGIDTTAVFKGTILALTSITVADGANIEGRLLARNGQVTLINDTIYLPTTCASVSTSTSTSSSIAGPSSVPYCSSFSCVTPIILESRRISPTSLFLSWGPYAGISQFSIQYGVENGKWLYNTEVTGFSATVNGLPPNQPIWFLIQPKDNCSIGPCGVAKLVGGPRLPSTGFGSEENNIPWNVAIPVVSLVGISVFLSLIQRKYRFLSRH